MQDGNQLIKLYYLRVEEKMTTEMLDRAESTRCPSGGFRSLAEALMNGQRSV